MNGSSAGVLAGGDAQLAQPSRVPVHAKGCACNLPDRMIPVCRRVAFREHAAVLEKVVPFGTRYAQRADGIRAVRWPGIGNARCNDGTGDQVVGDDDPRRDPVRGIECPLGDDAPLNEPVALHGLSLVAGLLTIGLVDPTRDGPSARTHVPSGFAVPSNSIFRSMQPVSCASSDGRPLTNVVVLALYFIVRLPS